MELLLFHDFPSIFEALKLFFLVPWGFDSPTLPWASTTVPVTGVKQQGNKEREKAVAFTQSSWNQGFIEQRRRYTSLSFSPCRIAFFFFFNLFIFVIFPLPFNPLKLPAPLQSPHCCPCPWVLFSFSSIPPPLTSPQYLLSCSLSMSLSLFCLLVQFVH